MLPPNVPKRGLSLDEAAEYCGVSRNTMVRHGPAPVKIGDRTVYDRRGLDRWLDHLGGISSDDATALEDPEERLLGAIHARKHSLRHPPR
jgi:predicted DNA-binding transcriptional regulator AlpA